MATNGKRTIFVGGAGENNSKPLQVEGVAVAATAAGTLLKQTASGLEAQNAASTTTGYVPYFADKNNMMGKSVDDAWTINENMVAIQPRSGDILNVLVATGQILVKGDALVSNGAGLLVKASALTTTALNSEYVIANADEALTTSGTTLVRVVIK